MWIHTTLEWVLAQSNMNSYKLQHYNRCLSQSNMNPHPRMDACTSPTWIRTPEWMLAQSNMNPYNTIMDACTVQCESTQHQNGFLHSPMWIHTTPKWMPAQSNVKPCNIGGMLAKTDMNHETLDWMFALFVSPRQHWNGCLHSLM